MSDRKDADRVDYFSEFLSRYRRLYAVRRLKGQIVSLLTVYSILSISQVTLLPIIADGQVLRSAAVVTALLSAGVLLYLSFRFYAYADPEHPVLNNETILSEAGTLLSGHQDRLLNAYQISRDAEDSLAELAARRVAEELPLQRLLGSIAFTRNTALNTVLVLVLVTAFSSFLILPQSWSRLWTGSAPAAYHFRLELKPGDLQIFPRDSVYIELDSDLPEPWVHELHLERADAVETVRLLPDSLGRRVLLLTSFEEELRYHATVRPADIFWPDFQVSSDTFRLIPVQRPRLNLLRFTVSPPAYTGLEKRVFTGNTDEITVEEGSSLSAAAVFRDPIRSGWLKRAAGRELFEVISDTELFWRGRILEDELLEMNFSSSQGVELEDALRYRIRVVPDRWPVLTLHAPLEELRFETDAVVPWEITVIDDHGFSRLAIEERIIRSFSPGEDTVWTVQPLPVPVYSRERLSGVYTVESFLSPGDRVLMRFVLSDNDGVNGPKTIRSREFSALFPSLTDMFEQNFSRQEENTEDLERLLQDVEESLEESQALREELLKESELSWEKRQAVEDLAGKSASQMEELKRIQEELETQLEEMQEKGLFSDETLQQFDELRKLVEDLAESEFFRELQKLQEKLQALQDREAERLPEDLETFREAQENFSRSLERTLELFRDILREEQLDELTARLKELAEAQDKILEDVSEKDSRQLAEMEQKLAAEAGRMEDFASALTEDEKQAFREMMESFQEEMEKNSPGRSAAGSAEDFRQARREAGREKAEMTAENLEKLQKQLGEMRQEYQEGRRREVLNAFHRIYRKTIANSFSQETLLDRYPRYQDLQNDFTPVIGEQFRIMSSYRSVIEDLNRLAAESFQVDRDLAVAAGQVMAALNLALHQLEEGNAFGWMKPAETVLSTHNQLAYLLLRKMEEIRESDDPTGMDQFMQQLQEMAQQQQGLNAKSGQMSLFGPSNSGKMDEMAELAARQQALRKTLAKLRAEMRSEGAEGLGDLDKVNRDMGDVVDELRQGRYSRQTQMRQQQILQRLLSASRSIRTRDRSEERESKTAESTMVQKDALLPEDLGEKESVLGLLRDALMKGEIPMQDKLDMERYIEALRFENVE